VNSEISPYDTSRNYLKKPAVGVFRTFEAWYAAISSHEAEQLLPFLLPQSRYEDVPTATISEGVDAVIAFFERVWSAIPDMTMTPTRVLQTHHGIAAEWIVSGTHSGDFPGLPATGNIFNVKGVSMIELAGGKVRRVSDYWDLLSSSLLQPTENASSLASFTDGSSGQRTDADLSTLSLEVLALIREHAPNIYALVDPTTVAITSSRDYETYRVSQVQYEAVYGNLLLWQGRQTRTCLCKESARD
jgi:steroid delta-isomerase-like uncharacterized protein